MGDDRSDAGYVSFIVCSLRQRNFHVGFHVGFHVDFHVGFHVGFLLPYRT